MKMLRTPTILSPNRSLVVLLVVLLITLAGIAAARELTGGLLAPSIPLYVPAENPPPPAPAGERSSLPMPTSETAPGGETGAAPFPPPPTGGPAPSAAY